MPNRLTALAILLAPAVAATATATPALASFGNPCPPGGCLLDPQDSPYGNNSFDFDYTVPPDGRTYLWAIDFTSADPLATITLGDPNQTEIFTTIRTATGFDTLYNGNPPYLFAPTIAPGRSTFRVRAPAEFDFCANPGPIGQTCAAVVHIWGNGTMLSINSTAPVLANFTETLVPEPATWAMLVVGFGLIGATMRRPSLSPSGRGRLARSAAG